MAQSAMVRDYRVLETGRRRASRLVLTVAEPLARRPSLFLALGTAAAPRAAARTTA